MYAKGAAAELAPLVRQAQVLAMHFDAVVANPPYMGGKGMNPALKDYAKATFPDSKSDLFAMFMERGFEWCKPSGFNSMVTMQSWMFLSSYEAMREKLLTQRTIQTMAHLGARAFAEISGEVVQTTAFVLQGQHFSGFKPAFFRLVEGQEAEKETALRTNQNRFDATLQDDFKKIPGSPVAYWASAPLLSAFDRSVMLGAIAAGKHGMSTGNNGKFVRLWFEIDFDKLGISCSTREVARSSKKKWFPYNKGGSYRKWYGNHEFVVDYENDGRKMISGAADGSNTGFRHDGRDSYFLPSVSWSFISSSHFGVRYYPQGFVFDVAGSSLFPAAEKINSVMGFMCSNVAPLIMKLLNPTLNFQVGNVVSLPYIEAADSELVSRAIEISKNDWDRYEVSWDFNCLPFLSDLNRDSLAESWSEFYLFTRSQFDCLLGIGSVAQIDRLRSDTLRK